MSESQDDGAVEITEADLSEVQGGLPAIQKVREAGGRLSSVAEDEPIATR